ncbi:MAG: response regulator transcription factor [Halioglobus sp.]
MLVDDHAMFRQGLKFLLSDLDQSLHFSEAGSCDQAISIYQETPVDLILLDLNMPGSDGLGALHQITTIAQGVPTVVLSGENDPGIIRAAIERGASGFVPKASSSEILVAALRLILAGGVYLPPNALNSVADEYVDPEKRGETHSALSELLSDRQVAVLLKAIQGQPNKVIAIDMGIAEGTVKSHLSAAYKVLGVHNRTEAVFAAARWGLKP